MQDVEHGCLNKAAGKWERDSNFQSFSSAVERLCATYYAELANVS